jgi:hypothetical protein
MLGFPKICYWMIANSSPPLNGWLRLLPLIEASKATFTRGKFDMNGKFHEYCLLEASPQSKSEYSSWSAAIETERRKGALVEPDELG